MNNMGWYLTSALGVLAAIVIPIANNCPYGAEICSVLTSVASGLALVLGITHPGHGLTPPPPDAPPAPPKP
jgi:hypothetical protein